MRRSQMKRYYLKRRTPQKNSEGGTIVAYADAVEIDAIIWPAGGKVQAEMYGERLAYIKNMEYGGDEMMKKAMAFAYLLAQMISLIIRLFRFKRSTTQREIRTGEIIMAVDGIQRLMKKFNELGSMDPIVHRL